MDKSGNAVLHEEARDGHEAVVRLLVEKGADLEAKNYYGMTALDVAAEKGHTALVQLLTP